MIYRKKIAFSITALIFILGASLCSYGDSEKIVAASFFYWYDYETGMHLWQGEPGKYQITYYPKYMDNTGNFPGVSYNNKEWLKEEIEDMIAAGINVIAPIIWPSDDPNHWSRVGLINLLDTMLQMQNEGYKVPKIAIFFDTSTIQFEEFARLEKETGKPVDTNDPARPWLVNLASKKNIERFYNCIRKCFIPLTGESAEEFSFDNFKPEDSKYHSLWATEDGFPIVFIWEAGKGFFFEDWNRELFDYIIAQFERDFHVKPRLFPDYEWSMKSELDNETPFNLNGGGYIRWRASVYEPYAMNEKVEMPYKGVDGIEFGPGYDDRIIPSRLSNGTPIRSRDNGLFYSYGWQYALRTKRNLVMIESWNELHEGTQINDSYQLGRKYINMNKDYSEKFTRDYSKFHTVRCSMAGFNDENLAVINDEDGLYQVDGAVVRSKEQPYNNKEIDFLLDPTPQTQGKTDLCVENNLLLRKTDNPKNPHIYFDIHDDYADSIRNSDSIYVHVCYLDKGKDSFQIVYSNPQKTTEKISKTDSNKLIWRTFKLDKATLDNSFAKDINFYSYVKQGCDFYIDSLGDGNEVVSQVIVSKASEIFIIDAKDKTYPGEEYSFCVTALKDGIKDKNFCGKIVISCSDESALAKTESEFSGSDNGEKKLKLKFKKSGVFFLSVYDAENPDIAAENFKVIVQKFRLTIDSQCERGKTSSLKALCLDDKGGVDEKYVGTIKFSKQNMDDAIPLKYTFKTEDKGKISFPFVINNYGKHPIIIEDAKEPSLKGMTEINIPVPICSANPDTAIGLKLIDADDGKFEKTLIKKRSYWQIPGSNVNHYLYFDIDDRLYSYLPRNNNIFILVKYFDKGTGRFLIEYDSNDEYSEPAGFKPTKTQLVALTDSKKQKTACFYIEDAYFGNRTKKGDFRIYAIDESLCISQVTVLPQYGEHPNLKTTFIKMPVTAEEIFTLISAIVLVALSFFMLIKAVKLKD